MRPCEMTRKDFKVGQTVYLKATSRRARYLHKTEHLKKACVIKVGTSYVYVKINGENGLEHKFDSTKNFRQADGDEYAPDWVLLLHPSQLAEEEQAQGCITKIKTVCTGKFGRISNQLPLDKLQRICSIIDE